MDSSLLLPVLLALIIIHLGITRIVAARKGRHGPWNYPIGEASPAFASEGWNRAVKLTTIVGISLGVGIFVGAGVSLLVWDSSTLGWSLYSVGILAMYSRSFVIEFGFAFAEPANPGSSGKEAWKPRSDGSPSFAADG